MVKDSNKQEKVFLKAHATVSPSFSEVYPSVNNILWRDGGEWTPCRGGEVKEVLDWKTTLTSPYRRLCGGHNRNMNVFFLLAEALWIAAGRKDTAWLTRFNGRMEQYSDDGVVFHAPYGYRLRHWSSASEIQGTQPGFDQVARAVRLLAADPSTRQVVLSIWNPLFDLGTDSRDIPCNDMVMLKVRGGRLITTIANRSNDLHLGLPTNVFQFSFLTECIAGALGVKLGTQTHNSQSLHVYRADGTAERMATSDCSVDLYEIAQCVPIDFHFTSEVAVNRWRELDWAFNVIIDNVTRFAEGDSENDSEVTHLRIFSNYLYVVYRLLKLYITYKEGVAGIPTASPRSLQQLRVQAFNDTNALLSEWFLGGTLPWDVQVMALNFFAARLTNETREQIPNLPAWMGKL